jgi:hypothetical protein
MSLPPNLIEQIAKKLPEKLGEKRFEIQIPSSSDIKIKGEPDLVIHDREKNKITLLSVSGSELSDDLPLAVVPVFLNLKEDNKKEDPQVVLISKSKITDQVKRYLDLGKIDFIEGHEEDQVVADIAQKLTGSRI